MSTLPTGKSTSLNGVEKRFKILLANTRCPYAETAVIRYAPLWNADLPIEENILSCIPHLNEFVAHGKNEGLDVFVIEVLDQSYIHQIDSFSRLLNCVLLTLRNTDPTHTGRLNENITTLEWDFIYRDVEFFVPTFAPFYKSNHTRYSHVEKSAFIMLQPDHCFDRRGINSKNPERQLISQRVKARFEKAGYQYDTKLVTGTPKAVRYIHPLEIGQDWVKWWVYNCDVMSKNS